MYTVRVVCSCDQRRYEEKAGRAFRLPPLHLPAITRSRRRLIAAEMRLPALQAAGLLTTAMMTAAPHHQLTMSEDMQERLSLLPKGERSRVVFQAAGLQLPFVKARGESKEHLLMKALLWSLMVDTEMNVECELDIGHRYKPGARHRPWLGLAEPPLPTDLIDRNRACRRCGGALGRRTAALVGRVWFGVRREALGAA